MSMYFIEHSTVVKQFLGHLKSERHFSEHTAKCYGGDLTQFAEFLMIDSETSHSYNISYSNSEYQRNSAVAVAIPVQQRVDELLLSVGTDSIKAFLTFLNEKHYSKATIARKLATLRSFYKFLVKRNQLTSNPVAPIRSPEKDKKLPHFLEYEEIKRLLNTPSLDNWLGVRDRAIMETLYSTGIRVSELVALNMDDIDFLGEVLRVRGEGKRERIVPVSSSALQVIQHYMEYRNKRAQINVNFDSKVLFVNKDGGPLNTRSVRRKMDKYLKMARLDLSISPCTLRHSCAMHMINSGANLRDIQELLGHQSLSTTKIYSRLSTKLKKTHLKNSSHKKR